MLHELLLSLWGCSSSSTLQVLDTNCVDLNKYLHPGERALIEKILDVVNDCNSVRKFIRNKSTIGEILKSSPELQDVCKGMYLRALCDGMDLGLEPFRKDVVEMESVVLNDNHTPISMILCRVQKYICLFSVLNSIISEITTQKLHGCKLLQCLHERMHTGIPEVKLVLEKMAYCVHVVFYKQLTSWLLYGHLEDSHNEFFITKVTNNQRSALRKSKNSADVIEEDNDKTFDIDMWDYDIRVNLLPSYIRPSLAMKILTIGQTVIMFGNDPRQKKDFGGTNFIENSIWGEKEYDYFHKLQNLQTKATFNVIEFEQTIDQLKQCITELLWRVAVEDAQLIQQLKFIKDFFLMGRGDLFLEFIRLTAHILSKPPTNHTSRDINLAFQMALRNMHLNDESAMDSFNFVVVSRNTDNDNCNSVQTAEISEKEREDPIEKHGWGLIILKYKVVWPLHLLFSPSALNDYNVLFRFLLRVKKTQIDLWNLWSEHMHFKTIDIGVIQLRNNLIFIIDNLQYYLQVDVLESQYSTMESNIRSTRNFEDIQRAHSVFLANVMSQTFLSGCATERKNPAS